MYFLEKEEDNEVAAGIGDAVCSIQVFAWPVTCLLKTNSRTIEKHFFGFGWCDSMLCQQFVNDSFQPDELLDLHDSVP